MQFKHLRHSFNVIILQLQGKSHIIWMHGGSTALSWDKWGNQVQFHSKGGEDGMMGTLAISSPFAYLFCLRIWRHLGKPGYEVGCQWHVIDYTSVVLEREELWQRIWALGRKNAYLIAFSQGIWYETGRGDRNTKLSWIKSGPSDLELV